MKTGTALLLAIGVPATVGVVAWALLANKIVDKVDDVPGNLPPPPPPPPAVTAPPGIRAVADADGKSYGLMIEDARALFNWAKREIQRTRNPHLGGSRKADKALAYLLAKVPRPNMALPIKGIVLEQLPSPNDEEWSDIVHALEERTTELTFAQVDAGLLERGL